MDKRRHKMDSYMHKKLVVCDLDNTLYDWVSYFVTSFYSMVDKVVELTNCDKEQLLDDFRSVHRKYGDSEHPFALLETKTVRRLFPGYSPKIVAEKLDPALFAFNSCRKRTLRAYPGVYEGLTEMKRAGIKLAAYSESNLFAAVDRLTRLKLDVFFERVYCRQRASSKHPNLKAQAAWSNRYSLEKFYEIPRQLRKPSAEVLHKICNRENVEICETAYVGDSISRDILMAKEAGVYSIWAKYGTTHALEDYERLVRITHWTPADVKRETQLKKFSKDIQADAVLDNNFREIIKVLHISR